MNRTRVFYELLPVSRSDTPVIPAVSRWGTLVRIPANVIGKQSSQPASQPASRFKYESQCFHNMYCAPVTGLMLHSHRSSVHE